MQCSYQEGQKIAKKLSKNISKETCNAKNLLDEYNAVSTQVEVLCPPK